LGLHRGVLVIEPVTKEIDLGHVKSPVAVFRQTLEHCLVAAITQLITHMAVCYYEACILMGVREQDNIYDLRSGRWSG
jgi:hypothetical protein